MQISREIFVRIEVVFLILLITIIPIGYILTDTTDQGNELKERDGGYRMYLEASQWEYKVYDLNKLNLNPDQFRGLDNEEKAKHEMKHRFHVEPGKNLTIYLTSRDVPHSIKIDEIDLYIAVMSPDVGVEFGPVGHDSALLPKEDAILEAKPHFDVGLGTDQMKISIYVGEPTLWINVVLSTVVGFMIVFFVYYSYNIYKGVNIFDRKQEDQSK